MSIAEAIRPSSLTGTEAVDIDVAWPWSDVAALAALLEETTAGTALQLLLMASSTETEWRCRFLPPEPGAVAGDEILELLERLEEAGIVVADAVRVTRLPGPPRVASGGSR